MRRKHKKSLLLLYLCLLVIVAVFFLLSLTKKSSSTHYVQALNSDFSDEFDGLNDILQSDGFKIGSLSRASCHTGSPNSGLDGLLICETSRNGSLTATHDQVSNWGNESQKIDTYLKGRSWKQHTGHRAYVTYSSLDSMFDKSIKGPVIVQYTKQFPNITCKFVLDVNREYPHQTFNQADVSERCEKDL